MTKRQSTEADNNDPYQKIDNRAAFPRARRARFRTLITAYDQAYGRSD